MFATFVCVPAVLANGTIDSSFGNNGFAVADFGLPSQSREMLLQADGKIIVIGEVRSSTDPKTARRDIGLARFHPDGQLDVSFGDNGEVITNVQNKSVFVNKAVLQPDGNIVITGTLIRDHDFYSGMVVRYKSNGSLDTTFGVNGVVLFNRFGGREYFFSTALQPDGKIIAGGHREVLDPVFPYRNFPMLVRFRSDGEVDESFGDSGVVVNDFFRDQIRSMSYNAVAIQPDGKVIAGGGLTDLIQISPAFHRGGIARLEPTGALDITFARRGFQRLFNETVLDIRLLATGSFLSAGTRVRRFLHDGYFDETFYVPNTFHSGYGGSRMDIRGDGKIAVVNPLSLGSSNDLAGLVRKDGGLIGFTTTSDTISGTCSDVNFQTDGKILFACSGYSDRTFRVVRYNTITSLARSVTNFATNDRSRIGVYRPSVGIWYLLDGTQQGQNGIQLGKAGDFVVPGDYDGDGQSDVAVWGRNQVSGSMEFCYKTSYPPSYQTKCVQWGASGDIPVAGDYDGDTLADYTVFRQGAWWTLRSSDLSPQVVNFGMSGDVPTPSDFDGDGITDAAVYRRSSGTWWVHRSSNGSTFSVQFGNATDEPVGGDYDGDGRADFAVYRPSEAIWHLLQTSAGLRSVSFGLNQDKPVPGDYDGDGKTDIAVFRPSEGNWYLQQSREGFQAVQWGSQNDIPLSSSYSTE